MRDGNDFEAHHIVPLRVKEAEQARHILQKYGIDINSHFNGVWLPKNAGTLNSMGGRMVAHRGSSGLHARNADYARAINSRLSRATDREGAEAILRGIRSDLRNGIEFWK